MQPENQTHFTEEARNFLEGHTSGTLSTLDVSSTIHSTPVYYIFADDLIYLLTKYGTKKMENIQHNPNVNLSLYDASTLESIEIHGVAELEGDNSIKDNVFTTMLQRHAKDGRLNSLPVTTLDTGGYAVLRVTPTNVTYTNFDA